MDQIRRVVGCPASAKRGPQTGDRGRVSNTGLIFYLHYAEASEQLLNQVILFVIERRAAQVSDTERTSNRERFIIFVLPVLVTSFFHARRNHLHRLLERDFFPCRAVRFPV